MDTQRLKKIYLIRVILVLNYICLLPLTYSLLPIAYSLFTIHH